MLDKTTEVRERLAGTVDEAIETITDATDEVASRFPSRKDGYDYLADVPSVDFFTEDAADILNDLTNTPELYADVIAIQTSVSDQHIAVTLVDDPKGETLRRVGDLRDVIEANGGSVSVDRRERTDEEFEQLVDRLARAD